MPAMRLIKITDRGIFFDEDECIPYVQTNLPKAHFTFKDRIDIYWLVALHPVPGDKTVKKVQVENYRPANTYAFADQSRMRTIPFLQFEKLDRAAFLNVCASCNVPSLERFFSHPSPPPAVQSVISPIQHPIHLPIVREYSVAFTVKFAEATIVDGAIVFEHLPEEIDVKLVFEIHNTSLKASYDTIKEYIAKKLGKKTFRVTAAIKKTGQKAVVENARSEDIARIDESFIQKVKEKRIRSLLHIEPSDGRSLRPMDELLSLSDELKGNLFQVSVEDIIQGLAGDTKHRNAGQLNYLAQQQDIEEVIYVTAAPYFGFVFYLLENTRRSYIWELLDSHATYIWSFENTDRDRIQEFEIIEQNINEIRAIRRNAYKQKQHNGRLIADCHFDTIQHAINGQNTDKSLDEWVMELKSKIKQQRME